MIVRELLTRLGFTVDEAGAKRYEQRMGRIRTASATLANNLGGVFGAIGFGLLANRVADVTSRFTDLESRLANMVGAEKAGDLFKNLREDAFLTYQNVEQVTEGFLQMFPSLRAVGMGADEARVFIRSLSDAFTTYGVKGDRAARAQMWINRALDKGVMRAEEWNGLNESASDLLDALAASLGKNRQQLLAMRDAGEITGDVLTEFFITKADAYRQSSESMAVTVSDAFTRIQGKLDEFIYTTDKGYGASAWFAQGLLVVAENIPILAGVVGLLLVPALMGLVLWVWSTVAAFTALAVAVLANPITWVVLAAVAAVIALALVVQDLWSYFSGGESVVGDIIDSLISGFNRVSAQVKQAWEDLKTSWFSVTELLKNNLVTAFTDAVASLRSIWDGFISWAGAAGARIAAPFKAAARGIRGFFGGGDAEGTEVDGARAAGGPVSAGGTYLTGEEGPELFTPSRSGHVLPAGITSLLRSSLAAGSRPGGGDIRFGAINITAPPGTTQEQAVDLAEQFERHLNTSLRRVFSGTMSHFPETA